MCLANEAIIIGTRKAPKVPAWGLFYSHCAGRAKPVDIAARLGHKDAAITQNLYTHDTEAMQKETARILGEVVGK